jgi:hypothetical protein
MSIRLNGSTSGYTEIDAPAVAGSNTIVLPSGNGSANQLLKNGSTAGSLEFSSSVYIDSSQRLLVGTSTSLAGAFSDQGLFQTVKADGAAGYTSWRFTNDDGGAIIYLNKSRSGTAGTNTIVQNNDILGSINFAGADGSTYHRGALIRAEVDGTPGTNDMPGRLVFSTTADGASSPTERMRIANDGSISSVIPGGSTLYPRFGCRAWVNFNGTGTVAIRASGNVSSITDNGTGDFTVNFTTALADANYSVVSAGSQQANDCISISSNAAPTTSAVRIQGYSRTDSFTAQDGTYNNIAIFR